MYIRITMINSSVEVIWLGARPFFGTTVWCSRLMIMVPKHILYHSILYDPSSEREINEGFYTLLR